jgi:hypothetical protein
VLNAKQLFAIAQTAELQPSELSLRFTVCGVEIITSLPDSSSGRGDFSEVEHLKGCERRNCAVSIGVIVLLANDWLAENARVATTSLEHLTH